MSHDHAKQNVVEKQAIFSIANADPTRCSEMGLSMRSKGLKIAFTRKRKGFQKGTRRFSTSRAALSSVPKTETMLSDCPSLTSDLA
jgi:hypothetical protein